MTSGKLSQSFLISISTTSLPSACCCKKCGNYIYTTSVKGQVYPRHIKCWKLQNIDGDCHRDPNKASPEQMKDRSTIIRNPHKENSKECSICLKDMKGRYVKKINGCGHTFHLKCLGKWEETKFSCPMCRYTYGKRKLEVFLNLYKKYTDFFLLFHNTIRNGHDVKNNFKKLEDTFWALESIVKKIKIHNGETPEDFHIAETVFEHWYEIYATDSESEN